MSNQEQELYLETSYHYLQTSVDTIDESDTMDHHTAINYLSKSATIKDTLANYPHSLTKDKCMVAMIQLNLQVFICLLNGLK